MSATLIISQPIPGDRIKRKPVRKVEGIPSQVRGSVVASIKAIP
jgi:hypothetical protein